MANKEYPRSHRIADQIQRELAHVIQTQLKDPRVSPLATVSGVNVTRNLSLATVFITLVDSEKASETVQALNHAAGFLRTEIASRLNIRTVPALRFRYDETPERGVYLSALIDEAVRSDERHGDTSD